MTSSLDKLIHELAKLPGIGERTALRLVFAMLRRNPQQMLDLARTLEEVVATVRLCSRCQNITESDPCTLCANQTRNANQLCVVEGPSECLAIEKSRQFQGQYHVLHGTLSPIDGIGPDDLKIPELLTRLKQHRIEELILALSPNVTGEVTTLYLRSLVKPLGIRVTQLAMGLPIGADIEYLDHLTLAKAFEHRKEI